MIAAILKNHGIMNAISKRFCLVFMLCVVGLSLSFGQNQMLPDVKIKKLDGSTVSLSSYGKNGKITVISFWATWCSPCKKELSNITELYPEWQSKYNAELLAISIDDTRNIAKVKSYVAGEGWEYEVLLDSNQDLKRELSFQTVPYTLLVNTEGKVVYKHTGYVEGDEFELEDKIMKLANK